MTDAYLLKLRELRREARERGFTGLLGALAGRLSPNNRREHRRKRADAAAFDSQGYDTGATAWLDGMTLATASGNGADCNPYDATPSYDFEAALGMLDMPLAGATFVDLGSGKGRLLMLAARHPFARIIGVEIAEELQAIARANLRRFAELHGPDPRIVLHSGDAADFPFPDGPLVVFLFNPFGAATIGRVAAALRASWKAAPRPIRIVYVNPQHHEAWPVAGFRQTALAPDFRFALYAPA